VRATVTQRMEQIMHLSTKKIFFKKPILLFGWRPCDTFAPASYRAVWGYNAGGGEGVEGGGGGLDEVRITLTPFPHGAVWPPRRDGLSSQRTGLHIALDVCFSTEISKGSNNSLPKRAERPFFSGGGDILCLGAGLVRREIKNFHWQILSNLSVYLYRSVPPLPSPSQLSVHSSQCQLLSPSPRSASDWPT